MCTVARYPALALAFSLLVAGESTAQQTAPGPQDNSQQTAPAAGAPQAQPPVTPVQAAPQAPPGFQLNVLQQQQLDLVLNAWQQKSATINTFECNFQRWEYDVAFGPRDKDKELPLFKNTGELTYNRPDKGSFEITEVTKWQEEPAPAGQQPSPERKGTWVKQTNVVRDHWVCDGKSVYQHRPDVKQLVEHPIPPQLQGQAIVDGPVPFLFGADAAKLKQRYWLRIDPQQPQNATQIWLQALPKFREQAADFSEVDVILDQKVLLPQYMQVWMPNRSHHVYIFDIAKASVNNPLARVKALFAPPMVPFGWQKVVENVPMQQAAQPAPPPR